MYMMTNKREKKARNRTDLIEVSKKGAIQD